MIPIASIGRIRVGQWTVRPPEGKVHATMQKSGTESRRQEADLLDRHALHALHADVAAIGFCQMSRSEIAAQRRNPGTLPDGTGLIAPSALRYSDEQTVVALTALQQAVGHLLETDDSFSNRWGVVAASRFLGRSHLQQALKRFHAEGVWGVSPHLIPHYALHSPAGTLSLALRIHGPNLGTGGGRFASTEGLLTALSWLVSGVVPGVWFVTSGWSPELEPDDDGQPRVATECQAIALGLVPAMPGSESGRPRLNLRVNRQSAEPRPLDLGALARRLTDAPMKPRAGTVRIPHHSPRRTRLRGVLGAPPRSDASDETGRASRGHGRHGTGLHRGAFRAPGREPGGTTMKAGPPVWITGVGLTTTLGSDPLTLEENLLAGRSGIAQVNAFPTDDYPSRIAARIARVPCPPGQDPAAFGAWPRLEQAACWCVESALRDAGLWDERDDLRIGLVLGFGAEWMQVWESDAERGGNRVDDPEQDEESTLERVQRACRLSGPSLTLSAACASSNYAFQIGRTWLRRGLVDLCVAGGCEMAVTPVGLATFGNLRALSRRNHDPQGASRPFDRGRDGFVLGEGGVAFVLERAGSARRRSARAYGEVAGCGASSDAHHHVIPSPDPRPAASAVRQALDDAGVAIEQVDHINAHATSTPVGDATEAEVLRLVFGEALQQIPVTSTKSMTGHLLTAAGAIEALACLTAMRHGAIPPTINLDDPEVDLNLVAREARPHPVEIAVSNSFGFGGSNTCLVLRAI